MVTKRIRIYGIVQGVGFRPSVSRHAAEAGVTGSVCNKGSFVEVIAQGQPDAVEKFIFLIEKKPPKRAVILKMDVKEVDAPLFPTFEIATSAKKKGRFSSRPTSRSATSAARSCSIRRTGATFIHSLTAHPAGRGSLFSRASPMTGSGPR